MLCNICSNIHFKHIENCELIQREPYRMRQDQQDAFISSVFYFHHKDKWALKSSADQGCHFCGMLWLNRFEDDGVNPGLSVGTEKTGSLFIMRNRT
jgi:hypothetical protein